MGTNLPDQCGAQIGGTAPLFLQDWSSRTGAGLGSGHWPLQPPGFVHGITVHSAWHGNVGVRVLDRPDRLPASILIIRLSSVFSLGCWIRFWLRPVASVAEAWKQVSTVKFRPPKRKSGFRLPEVSVVQALGHWGWARLLSPRIHGKRCVLYDHRHVKRNFGLQH